MQIENIKSEIKHILSLCPVVETLELNGLGAIRKFDKKLDFGNEILELLNNPEVADITLSVVKQKGYFGQCVNNIEDAINRNLINKNVEKLTFHVISIHQKPSIENEKWYGRGVNMGD